MPTSESLTDDGDPLQRRPTSSALQRSEQRLRALMSAMPVILFAVNAEGTIEFIDGRGLADLGLSSEQVVGRTVAEIFGEHGQIDDSTHRALGGETFSLVAQIGSRHYDLRYSPIHDADGSLLGTIGVAADISDRVQIEVELKDSIEHLTLLRRLERELSETLDIDSVLMIAMDAALRVTGADDAFIGLISDDRVKIVYSIGGYTVGTSFPLGEGVIGRALRTKMPQLVTDVRRDPDYVIGVPATRAQMVLPLIHHDRMIGVLSLETTRPERFTAQGLDFLNLITARITVAIDNANLYRVSQEQLASLHELYQRVSDLEQLKTDMIRVAAHDLRNPLTRVLGYAELLADDETLSPDQADFVDSIHRSGNHMLRIVSDILSLERIEAMIEGVPETPVSMNEITQQVFDDLRDHARDKQQHYTLELPDELLQACGEAAHLREACINLVGNAIKYTPAGGSVTVRLTSDSRGSARFEVEDTGFGVPEDLQARLFQPFFRAKTEHTRSIQGTGLGLHLVKKIVERHGGTMHFTSETGAGSTFGFTLPRRTQQP
jgi:PAS domain S-box-containing protein